MSRSRAERAMRRAAVAIAAATFAAACGGEPEGPVAAPYPGAEEPRVVEAGEVPFVEYATPRETLFVRERAPTRDGVYLLFFRGQGVSRDAKGSAYVTDPEASRVLVVGSGLRVTRVVGGPSAEDGALGLPLSAAPTPQGGTFVVDVEHREGLVYFEPVGAHVGAASPPVAQPNLATDPTGGLWAARSPYVLGFEATAPGSPLLYRFDPLIGEGIGIAEIEPIAAGDWNRLVNAGPVAAGPDGTGYFAFLLRNELRAYTPDGELRWRSRRDPGFPTPPPRIETGEGGEVRMRVRPVTQALAVGPDGLLYALTASDDPAADGAGGGSEDAASGAEDAGEAGEGPGWRRVEVYDPASGALMRASRVPVGWTTLAVDPEGRVYRADPERIMGSAPRPPRPPLPEVALETFEGETVGFEAYLGKTLLINFWASWCEPCKRELPELKEYYDRLDHERVEFLAVSEDTDEAAARRFAASLELPFPLFLGRGRMRDHFRYMGLPYTLVADYRGRIVAEFMGFGNPESWRLLTETLEEEIARAASAAAPDGGAAGHDHEHEHGGGDASGHGEHGGDDGARRGVR